MEKTKPIVVACIITCNEEKNIAKVIAGAQADKKIIEILGSKFD